MNKPSGGAAKSAAPAKASKAAAPAKSSGGGGYTMEEVAKHTKKDDCWVVLHDRVLNVTNFLSQHPGGELAILTFAGKDATAEFDMIHPPDVISKYAPDAVIGVLGGAAQQDDLEAGVSSGRSGAAKKAILAPPPHQPVDNDNLCLRCFKDTKWCFVKFDGVTWGLFILTMVFMCLVFL